MFVLLLLLHLLGVPAEGVFPVPVRLAEGVGRCNGTVELQSKGEWRRVKASDFWQSLTLSTVCEGLGCGAPVYIKQSQDYPESELWLIEQQCLQMATLTECVLKSAGTDGVRVECSESLRLRPGPSTCSGVVQLQLDRSWGSVCDGALDLKAAEVLCRELGCGAPSALQRVLSIESGPLLEHKFTCDGYEAALINCSRSSYSCTSGVAAVVCSEPVRLVGGSGRCQGTVEVGFRGQWSKLYTYQDNSWDVDFSAAVCRDLDCGSPVSMTTGEPAESPPSRVPPECVKPKKTSVRDCMFNHTSPSMGSLDVVCSDSVRLRSGPTLCSGTVQVRLDRSWSTVCDGALDLKDAEVLCRELGCGAPALLQGALPEDGAPLGQTFHCEGHESGLKDCPRSTSFCTSGVAVALTCSEPVRLVGEASRCAGTMELKGVGEWMRVSPTGMWDLQSGVVVCRDLDCGSPVSVEVLDSLPAVTSLTLGAKCLFDKHSGVRQCVSSWPAQPTKAVRVVCSDLLHLPSISVIDSVSGSELSRVSLGSSFRVRCTVDPQYPGGSFELLSPTVSTARQPTLNHTAHFLFSDAGPAHNGEYTCVFNQQVFSHNFTSNHSLQIQDGVVISGQAAAFSQLTSLLLLLLGLAAYHMV